MLSHLELFSGISERVGIKREVLPLKQKQIYIYIVSLLICFQKSFKSELTQICQCRQQVWKPRVAVGRRGGVKFFFYTEGVGNEARRLRDALKPALPTPGLMDYCS